MSRKSLSKHSATVATKKIGGAYQTKKQRLHICNLFIEWCFKNGYLFNSLKDISQEMLIAYFQSLEVDGVSVATQHNRLSAISKAYKVLQPHSSSSIDFLDISTKTIGLQPRNRAGTKLPIPDDMFQAVIKRAESLNEPAPGFVIALRLQRLLGLRGLESLMSVRDLEQYALEAVDFTKVPIQRGTKGGRPRVTTIIQSKALETLQVIQEALRFMKTNGGYLIVCGKNGITSAMSKYRRLAIEVGLVGVYAPHSIRYAYCVDKIIELRDSGCNRKEATSLAAQFLGHGDSRGRYVSMVYGRSVVHTLPIETRKSRISRALANVDKMIDDQRIRFNRKNPENPNSSGGAIG